MIDKFNIVTSTNLACVQNSFQKVLFVNQNLETQNLYSETKNENSFNPTSKSSKHLKGQLWPRVRHVFVYSCPAPLPGQLWPRVRHVFVYSCPGFTVFPQNIPARTVSWPDDPV